MQSAAQHRGDDDQRDVDAEQDPRVRGTGRGDDQQPDQLDHRHADVAAARVQAQRPALRRSREEGVDVRHRRGEVAAADAGERGHHHEGRVRRAGVHDDRGEDRRHQQQQRAERSSSCGRRTGPPRRCRAAAARPPTRVGIEPGRTCPAGSMPYSGPMNSTMTDHRVQIEKPMCSERTENSRLRLAILAPVAPRSSRPRAPTARSSGRATRLPRAVPVVHGAVVVTRTYLRRRGTLPLPHDA